MATPNVKEALVDQVVSADPDTFDHARIMGYITRPLETESPEAQYLAVTRHPDIRVEVEGPFASRPKIKSVSFFGVDLRFKTLEGAESLRPFFYIRERVNPSAGEDPVELVIGIRSEGEEDPHAQLVLKNTSRRIDWGKTVHYDRNTLAWRATKNDEVFIASLSKPNVVHPLEGAETPEEGYLMDGSQILVHPNRSIIIIPDFAPDIHTNLLNPTIEPRPIRHGGI